MSAEQGPLAGRRALVTGGAKRVGRAICLELARQGSDVVVHYHASEDQAHETAGALAEEGVTAATVQADLAAPDQVEGLLARAGQALDSPVDLVVNNASVFPEATLAESTWEDVDAMMRLHAWAPLSLARQLADQGEGAVVNLLDTRVVKSDPRHVPYMISKRALHDLTAELARLLAPGVRVNAVAPGAILAPEGKGEEHLEAAAEVAPLKRSGRPEEIAQAVAYLAGAGFVTGQTLFVDGGRHLV